MSERRHVRSKKGILLILVSGILVMLVLGVILFAQLIVFQDRLADSTIAAWQVRTTVESGMEYAMARLVSGRSDLSVPRTAALRGDDWQYRDGGEYRREPGDDFADYPVPVPLKAADNPSFGRGDPWQDGGGPVPGARDTEEPPLADLDGDGKFSAWSGRLRGGRTPFSLRFSLKVDPGPTCRINVNSWNVGIGQPWSGTNYGFGNVFDGVNGRVAAALNGLGVVLGLGDVQTIRPGFPVSPEYQVVRYSDIGNRVLANRPVGTGYQSMEAVRQALSGGPVPLTDAQWRILEPHLTITDGRQDLAGFGYLNSMDTITLDLRGAPEALLHLPWMYVIMKKRSGRLQYLPNGDLQLAGGGTEMDPRTARNFGEVIALFPDEVASIVQGIAQRRRNGIQDNDDTLHRHALNGLLAPGQGHAPLGASPAERALYLALKADLFVFGTKWSGAAPALFWGGGQKPLSPRAWLTRGFDRDPEAPGVQAERVDAPAYPFDMPATGGDFSGLEPYEAAVADPFGPQPLVPWRGYWHGPIRSFRVTSLGTAGPVASTTAVTDGDLLLGVGVTLKRQEDFENLGFRRNEENAYFDPGHPRQIAGGVFLHDLGNFAGTQSLPGTYPGKSFWVPGETGIGSGWSCVTLAEGEEDFIAASPTIRWGFTPDASFDAAGTDGPEHARGVGQYPFADNSPQPLFFNQQPLYAYFHGQTLAAPEPILAMDPTVGVGHREDQIAQADAVYHLTASDRGFFVEGSPNAPSVIADAAKTPAPLPMMPARNSDGVLIEVPLPSPKDRLEAQSEPVYAPHEFQPRCLLEGGFEVWVTQATKFSTTPTVTVPLVKLSAGGYQWTDPVSDPFLRDRFPQEVTLDLHIPAVGPPVYRLTSRCNLPAARAYYPTFPMGPMFRQTGSWNSLHTVSIPVPERPGGQGGHSDHILVEWKTLSVQRHAPANWFSPSLQDVMPRMEVTLRITLNGTVTHEQTHVSTLNYATKSTGEIDLSSFGGPTFIQQVAFIPPWGRVNKGEDSYLDIELRHCDQMALYNAYRPGPVPPRAFKDRFRTSGDYASPRIVFPRGARLGWAGWTAAVNEPLRDPSFPPPVVCAVQGFEDTDGLVPSGGLLMAGSLSSPAAWFDSGRCRSARFFVHFQVPADGDGKATPDVCDDPVAPPGQSPLGTGSLVDPPALEDLSLFLVRPVWLSR